NSPTVVPLFGSVPIDGIGKNGSRDTSYQCSNWGGGGGGASEFPPPASGACCASATLRPDSVASRSATILTLYIFSATSRSTSVVVQCQLLSDCPWSRRETASSTNHPGPRRAAPRRSRSRSLSTHHAAACKPRPAATGRHVAPPTIPAVEVPPRFPKRQAPCATAQRAPHTGHSALAFHLGL